MVLVLICVNIIRVYRKKNDSPRPCCVLKNWFVTLDSPGLCLQNTSALPVSSRFLLSWTVEAVNIVTATWI